MRKELDGENTKAADGERGSDCGISDRRINKEEKKTEACYPLSSTAALGRFLSHPFPNPVVP